MAGRGDGGVSRETLAALAAFVVLMMACGGVGEAAAAVGCGVRAREVTDCGSTRCCGVTKAGRNKVAFRVCPGLSAVACGGVCCALCAGADIVTTGLPLTVAI